MYFLSYSSHLTPDAKQNVFNVECIGNLSNSDHSIIKIEFDVSPVFNVTSQKVLNWRKGDKDGLKNHLSEIDFSAEFQNKGMDEAWAVFRDIIEAGA